MRHIGTARYSSQKLAHHVGAEQVHLRVVARLEALCDRLEVDGKAVGRRACSCVRVLLKGPRQRSVTESTSLMDS